MTHGWQGVIIQNSTVNRTMFRHNKIHINVPFTRSHKSKDVEIVGAEI